MTNTALKNPLYPRLTQPEGQVKNQKTALLLTYYNSF